jgi:CheY-like chemotaxis protein
MASSKSRGRVLVVEDDESAALFVTRVLERAGFSPVWTSDGKTAASHLEQAGFDVLLTDLRLPGQDGLELIGAARASWPAMGIAAMTSFDEPGLAATARSFGADRFLEKPLNPNDLVVCIDELVGRGTGSDGGTGGSSARDGNRVAASALRAAAGRGDAPAAGGHEERGATAGGAEETAGASPRFYVIGAAASVLPAVSLWASAAPVVAHLASPTGPVTSLRTRAAWCFAD